MSKDFERAYKELAESEAPDLWGRIEAGLSERSTQELTEAEEKAAGKKKKRHSREILYGIYRYSAMAAAVICVIIILPIFISGDRSPHSTESIEEETADTTGIDMAAGALADEGIPEAEAMEESVPEESVTEESALQESVTEESALQESVMEESAADAGGRDAMAHEAESAEKGEAKYGSENLQGALQDASRGAAICRVVVEVTGSEDVFSKENAQESGTRYTALVQKDPQGILAEGEEIDIFIPAYSSVALVKGESFELDLEYGGAESFTVCGFYGQVKE